MEIHSFLETVHLAERLKDTPRHCHTSGGRRESVAEHSWRISLMAMLLRDEFPEADMDRVIKMCLVHDLGEAFTGDIPVFEKTDADEAREQRLLYGWISSLPAPNSDELRSLFDEMDARTSREAMIFKALDSVEALIQHNEAGPADWLPNEYDLQRYYAADRMSFSPYTAQLRQAVRDESAALIAALGCPEGIHIRRAVPADEDTITQLYEEIHDAEEAGELSVGWIRGVYPTRQTVQTGITAYDFFVLECDGSIAAAGRINRQQMPEYAAVDWQWAADESQVSILHTLAVRPSASGRALGREFVLFYHRYAAESGSPVLRIDTNANNARARKFYNRLGYREAGIIPCTFNGIPGVNLVCLEHAPAEDHYTPEISLKRV